MEIFLVLAVAGVAYYLSSSKKEAVAAAPGTGGGGAGTGAKECPYGVDGPMPEGVRNAVAAALTMETDPAALEEFAVAMDKICQGKTASVLRQKAAALKKLEVPAGYDPNTMQLPPNVVGTTPNPTSGGAVVDIGEFSREENGATQPTIPKPGFMSFPDTQWWTRAWTANDSLDKLAAKVTGSPARYIELVAANPEKKTIGSPGNPFATGYGFIEVQIGEQLRLPRTWNVYIDQLGFASGGNILPVDPELQTSASMPSPLPSSLPTPPAIPGTETPAWPWPSMPDL